MPLDAADIVLDLVVDGPALEVAVHGQQLRVALDLAAVLVDVQRAKVSPELSLSVGANVGKVLVLEDDNAALGREQRQLVALLAGQTDQLKTAHFGADGGRDLFKS